MNKQFLSRDEALEWCPCETLHRVKLEKEDTLSQHMKDDFSTSY